MIIPTNISKALSLNQFSFLQAFLAKAPAYLSSCIMMKSYPQKHMLISTDDVCAHIYILLKGRLQATEERLANEPYHFAELSAIEIVGDFELFAEQSNRIVTLTTLTPTLCLIIPSSDYLSWIRNDANALFIRTQMLIRQLSTQTQFERQNFFMDNRTRFLHFLYSECQKYPDSSFPIKIKNTREEISCKLGCSVRTVNRTIFNLQNEGIFNLEHGKIKLTSSQHWLLAQYVENVLSQ